MRSDVSGADQLRRLEHHEIPRDAAGRPAALPPLREGESVVAGVDQGLGERLIVCESAAELGELYDKEGRGIICRLAFYAGPDPGFLIPL